MAFENGSVIKNVLTQIAVNFVGTTCLNAI